MKNKKESVAETNQRICMESSWLYQMFQENKLNVKEKQELLQRILGIRKPAEFEMYF